jgi:hypothetical protein
MENARRGTEKNLKKISLIFGGGENATFASILFTVPSRNWLCAKNAFT